MLPIFRGAATALLTPFRPDGSIDLPAWDRLLERQLDAGIAALVVCGTTGEAAALTQDERLTLLRRAKQAACGHCPVIMGVGTNCTAGSVENAELAAQNGADALLAVTPYYIIKGRRQACLRTIPRSRTRLPCRSCSIMFRHAPASTSCRRRCGRSPAIRILQASRKPAAASAEPHSYWPGADFRYGAATTTRQPRSWRSAAAA